MKKGRDVGGNALCTQLLRSSISENLDQRDSRLSSRRSALGAGGHEDFQAVNARMAELAAKKEIERLKNELQVKETALAACTARARDCASGGLNFHKPPRPPPKRYICPPMALAV